MPTVAETVPGYEATAWFGIGMPKGTPRDVIDKINAEINRMLADPEMRDRLAELGGKPIGGTPEDFGKVIAAETAKRGEGRDLVGRQGRIAGVPREGARRRPMSARGEQTSSRSAALRSPPPAP